jgi:hypothetical protein
MVSPLERQPARRRDMQEAEAGGTGSPLETGRLGPRPLNGERARHRGQAVGAIRVVVDGRQGIGARLQAKRILFSIRIGFMDGGNEARHSTLACWTRKLGGMTHLPAPEEAEEHPEKPSPPPPHTPTPACHPLPIGVHKGSFHALCHERVIIMSPVRPLPSLVIRGTVRVPSLEEG